MSPRNREASLLVMAGALAVVAYVAVYTGQFREITRWSLVYAGIFVAIFAVLHLVMRVRLAAADPFLLPVAALLAAIGLAEIYRISPGLALLQGRWLVAGAAVFILTVFLVRDPAALDRYRYVIGALGLLLLAVTILLGTEINGAKLWLRFAGFGFQPSEFAKICIVVFLAGYLNDKKELLSVPTGKLLGMPVPRFRYFGPLLLVWALSILLLVFMRDFGASLLLLTIFIALIYMATSRLVYALVGMTLFGIGAFLAYELVPHVQDRFAIWIDPWATADTTGYQLLQSLFTMADGGVLGQGLGRGYLLFPDGRPVVPDLQTDFIFSAVANELGMLGAVGVILCYLLFCWRGFNIALRATDGFTKLLAAGLSAAFALQTFIIIGGVTRLIPLTGITLPFLSYGGSSLLANMMLLALLLLVSQRENAVPVPAGEGRLQPAGGW